MKDVLFSWLHLSDIHGGHGDEEYRDDQRWSVRALLDVFETMPEGIPSIDAVFVTGDVGFSGAKRSADEYELSLDLLRKIRDKLGIPPERVFIVPGNHDVDRSVAEGDSELRAALEAARAGSHGVSSTLDAHGDAFQRRLAAYRAFLANAAPDLAKVLTNDGAWHVDIAARAGFQVRIVGLNTALLAQDDQDQGRLRIGSRQLSVLNDDRAANRVVLTLGHHPLSWLADDAAIIERVTRYSNVYLHGHVHRQRFQRSVDGGGEEAITLIAGAVHVDPGEVGDRWVRDAFNFGAIVAKPGGPGVRIAPYVRHQARFILDAANVPPNKLQAEHPLRQPPLTKVTTQISAELPRSAYQSPLEVYVVWHPDYLEGPEVARAVYKLLHRDIGAPLTPGLDVPVFYRTGLADGAVTPPIPSTAVNTTVIVLADATLARDQAWREPLRRLTAADDKCRKSYVVGLHELALKIRGVNQYQFLRLWDQQGLERNSDLENRLLHLLARQLLAPEPGILAGPINVFVSHAKKDGVEVAQNLRAFLQSDKSQLATFFDQRDITPGERYAAAIDNALDDPRALLLVVLTDEFAKREVCRDEVARAMLERRPIVAVDARRANVQQNADFLGPVPLLPYRPDSRDFWRELLRTVMIEALRFAYVPAYLRSIEGLYGDTNRSLHLARQPMLQDLGNGSKYDHLLHPDPPLFPASRAPFAAAHAGLRLATPSTLLLVRP